MILRAGIKKIGEEEIDMSAISTTDIEAVGDAGISGGAEILAFLDALHGRDRAAIGATRDRLRAALGDEAFVDIAGVASCFEAFNRIADATGIPLDADMMQFSVNIREKLNINTFDSRQRPEGE